MKYSVFSVLFIFIWLCGYSSFAGTRNDYKLVSPDKSTVLHIGLDAQGKLIYHIDYKHQTALLSSAMGLNINHVNIGDSVLISGSVTSRHNEIFDWPLGESSRVENNYTQLILHCQTAGVKFDVISRVFNGSVAFRYRIVAKDSLQQFQLRNEATSYNLPEPATIYQYNQESIFRPLDVNDFNTCDFPATLVCRNHLYLTIGEAENRNFTKCQLDKGKIKNGLALTFYVDTLFKNHQVDHINKDTLVRFTGGFQTPWRTISIASSAIGLHDYSQLYLKLTTPTSNTFPVFVKPGKLIRAQLNTQSGIDCIDFASKHNFQYVMFDGGWYGAEFRTVSDPLKPIPAIDLPKVIAYGKEKGIGVILYVNYVGLRSKLDSILLQYKKWGVSGMKFGFVDGGTQNGLSWLDSAMRKVNDHGFILDVHDNYKPTGLSRSYPFSLTQEGIRGDENSPDAFHTTVLPFTRFLAGPADFTFCYPNAKNSFVKNIKVSMAQQLALTVVYFSPLQSIFWYGNPKDYTNEDEIEFLKYVPTVWDESHYLAGEIGEYISVARRKGTTWFMGNIAGLSDWKQTIKLDFLTKGKVYNLTIYEDDDLKSICKRILTVKKGDLLNVELKAKGGQALIIRPVI
ncbi:glycoside hydrolase family 97 protein [Mucilaginibacter sp. L196]|uniref:glycoside hydrolase family 97 protein n=1 Tax=Mucilaginibacter sp. L196 TaxID=1641870 RepID=UPI00131DB549|nr:glycoside hydrolase family 97 protein [Mucilaginibacter sp. L196]